jgi:4-hydroxybutyryl-CoA dehydratase/vinylacetyl-CoA-Delta-isomerase
MGDVLIGAVSALTACQGVAKAAHVRDKLAEMIHLNETLFAGGIACSALGQSTGAGNYLIDLLLANVCKLNVTRLPFEIARLAQDLAGGLLATLPAAADFLSPETGPILTKYLVGARPGNTTERQGLLRLIEAMTLGTGAACYLTESMHGAGSPQAQKIMLQRLGGLAEKEAWARALIAEDLPPDRP